MKPVILGGHERPIKDIIFKLINKNGFEIYENWFK